MRIEVAITCLATALALALRWYYVVHAQVYQPLRDHSEFGGAAEYYRYAWNLFQHHVFSSSYMDDPRAVPDTFRDPGYPAYIAAFMALTSSYDEWYAAVLLSQAVLGALSVACIVLALRGKVPNWLLAGIALLAACWPHSVAMPSYVLSENVTTFTWALSALLLREAADRRSLPFSIGAGVALAAASLTNAVLAPLVIFLVLVLALKKAMPRHLLAGLVIATLLPLAAWGVRNSQVPAVMTSSYRAEVNLVQGSWPSYHIVTQLYTRHDPRGVQAASVINAEIDLLHDDPVAGLRQLAARMGRAPGTYAAWYLSKPALLWGWQIGLGAGGMYIYPTRFSPFITQPAWRAVDAIAFITNGLLAALALLGVGLCLWKKTTSVPMLVFAVTAAWVTLVYSVLQADPRYSIPFRGAEFALAGFAAWMAARAIRRRSTASPE
ncbi:hypothetical protein [Luteibacter yeojuensis]|uniref:hypothetical protein n=1 Tax=Luteibacter yeojuensis TaxID=345309 RepID=UPI0012ED7EFA|nr:hypothetical protein [Luteibacter yeojuensis]